MLQNAKQRGIPSSCYLLPVVNLSLWDTRGTYPYVLQLNNTGLILSTWEGRLAEQKAFSSWWYRWEQSREAAHTCWLNCWLGGVNSRPFFVIQGHREMLIFVQLLVSMKTKVTFHWFRSNTDVKQRRWVLISFGKQAIALFLLQGYSPCNYTVSWDEWPQFMFQA